MTGTWWPPYDGSTSRQWWSRFLALLAVLLATGLATVVLMPEGAGTIVDFELAGDDDALRFLDSWRGDGLWRVALAVIVDFPFLVAYGVGGAMIVDGLARHARPLNERWARFLGRFAWVLLAAAAFDVLENLALLVVLTDRVDGWPDLAATLARVKFSLVVLWLVGLVLAAVSAAGTRPRPST